MENRKFIIIYAILIVILLAMVVFSAVMTAIKSDKKNDLDISIDTFNEIILKNNVFNSSKMKDISNDELEEMLDISIDDIEVFYGKKSVLSTDASMYILVKVKDNNNEALLEKINTFAKEYELKWEKYLESEYDIVKTRKIGSMSDFVYIVISDDADNIIRDVENSKI